MVYEYYFFFYIKFSPTTINTVSNIFSNIFIIFFVFFLRVIIGGKTKISIQGGQN